MSLFCPKDGNPCEIEKCWQEGCPKMDGALLCIRCTICGELTNMDTHWCGCERGDHAACEGHDEP